MTEKRYPMEVLFGRKWRPCTIADGIILRNLGYKVRWFSMTGHDTLADRRQGNG